LAQLRTPLVSLCGNTGIVLAGTRLGGTQIRSAKNWVSDFIRGDFGVHLLSTAGEYDGHYL